MISSKVWNRFSAKEKAAYAVLYDAGYSTPHIKKFFKAVKAVFGTNARFTKGMGHVIYLGYHYEWIGNAYYYTEAFKKRERV